MSAGNDSTPQLQKSPGSAFSLPFFTPAAPVGSLPNSTPYKNIIDEAIWLVTCKEFSPFEFCCGTSLLLHLQSVAFIHLASIRRSKTRKKLGVAI